jgi:hypothetical protein
MDAGKNLALLLKIVEGIVHLLNSHRDLVSIGSFGSRGGQVISVRFLYRGKLWHDLIARKELSQS